MLATKKCFLLRKLLTRMLSELSYSQEWLVVIVEIQQQAYMLTRSMVSLSFSLALAHWFSPNLTSLL